jgi:preprotein translocase subunit SecF
MELIQPGNKFKFMKLRKTFLMLSGLLMIGCIGILAVKGLNYGIDFRGGTELQYQFQNEVAISDIRSSLFSAGKPDAIVQKVHGTETHEYLISFRLDKNGQGTKESEITPIFEKTFPTESVILRKADSVGPRVGADLKMAAILAVLYAVLLILGYLWFRFNITFSPAAVVALLHDVIFTMGVLTLLQIEFSLSIVAALLTIVGYSLNDTIVTFDRVRDNLIHIGKLSLENILDRSINECLNRTLLTSITTFIVVVVLILMGGPSLYPFAITMAIGIIVGTYSSIFIASPTVLFLDNWNNIRKQRQKLAPSR